MYCPNCNSNLMDGTKKCPFCGTEFNSDPNSAPQQNYNTPQSNYNSPQSNYNMPRQNSFGYNNYMPTNPPKVNFGSKPNSLGIIASIIMFVAIFLPFFSVSLFGFSANASLFDGDHWMIFAPVAVISFIFSAMKLNKLVLATGAVSVILTILEAIYVSEHRIKSKMDGLGDLGEYWDELADSFSISYSYGFYMLLAGSVLLLAAGIYSLKKNGSSSF